MRVQPSIDQRRVPDIFVFHVFFLGYEGDFAAIYDDVDGNDVEVSIQIPADAISGLYCWLYWEMTTIMMKWKMKKEMMTHCKFNIKSFVHAGEMTFRKRKLFLAHKVECNPRLKLNETFKRNSGKPSCLSPMCPDTWWGGRWPLRGRYLCHYLHHCRRHQSPPFITIEAKDQNQDNLDPHLGSCNQHNLPIPTDSTTTIFVLHRQHHCLNRRRSPITCKGWSLVLKLTELRTSSRWWLGLLSLILKSLIKSLKQKSDIGAYIRIKFAICVMAVWIFV